MKNICRIIQAVSFIILLSPASGALITTESEHENDSRWFLLSSLGPELTDTTDVTLNFTAAPDRIKLDPGYRLDVTVGYRPRPYLVLELENGLIANRIQSITASPRMKADLLQISHVINFRIQRNHEKNFSPYAGLGVGSVTDWLDIDRATIQGSDLRANKGANAMAGQVFVGFDYYVSPHLHFGCAYKGLWTTSPEWNLPSYDPSKTFGVIKLSSPMSHSAEVSFIWNF